VNEIGFCGEEHRGKSIPGVWGKGVKLNGFAFYFDLI